VSRQWPRPSPIAPPFPAPRPFLRAPADHAALAGIQGREAGGRCQPGSGEGAGGHESLTPALGACGVRARAEKQRVGERGRPTGEEAAQGAVTAGAGTAPRRGPAQALRHVLGSQLLTSRVCCTRLRRVQAAVPFCGARRPWLGGGQAAVLRVPYEARFTPTPPLEVGGGAQNSRADRAWPIVNDRTSFAGMGSRRFWGCPHTSRKEARLNLPQ
jgi:hypothetical protein